MRGKTMICPRCGAQIPDGVRFCKYCGAAFGRPTVNNVSGGHPVHTDAPNNVTCGMPRPGGMGYPQESPVRQEPTPKNTKKIVVPIVIGAVAVVVIAAVVAVICSAFSPESVVLRASKKSGEEFAELFEDSEEFSRFFENFAKISSLGEYNADLDFDYNTILQDSVSFTDVSLKVNVAERSASVNGDLVSKSSSHTESISVKAYMDENDITLALPDILDESYSVPLDKLGEKFIDSEMGDLMLGDLADEQLDLIGKIDLDPYADVTYEAFKKHDTEAVKVFEESLVIEKSDKIIPNADVDMKVYRVACDMEALADMIDSYSSFSMVTRYGIDRETLDDYYNMTYGHDYPLPYSTAVEYLREHEIELYLGIDGGCVKALCFEDVSDGEGESATMLLVGKDNIWETVEFYNGEELTVEAGYMQKDNGFVWTFNFDDTDLIVTCDDDACELTLSAIVGENDAEDLVIKYGAKDNGCQMSFELVEESKLILTNYQYKQELKVSASMFPKANVEKITDPVNFFDLTEDQLREIAEKINDAVVD